MSVKIMGLVWDLDNDVIDREEKYILLAYADHADHKGFNIYPSIATVCQKTGYKERAAQIITRSLTEKGFMVADGRGPKGTNKWRIPLDKDGARIAPAKNAPPQKDVDWGADGRVEGGALANAPEPSETPEPSDEIKKVKEILLGSISSLAPSVFGNDLTAWWSVRRRLEEDAISIVGEKDAKPDINNPMKITVSGLGVRPNGGQFSEAEIWHDRFYRSFANLGLEITFTE